MKHNATWIIMKSNCCWKCPCSAWNILWMKWHVVDDFEAWTFNDWHDAWLMAKASMASTLILDLRSDAAISAEQWVIAVKWQFSQLVSVWGCQIISVVGAHHQNGVAERNIQTIMSWALSMMLHHPPKHILDANGTRHPVWQKKHSQTQLLLNDLHANVPHRNNWIL